MPGFEVTTWFVLFAPARTPKAVVVKINAELQRVFKWPQVADKLKGQGLCEVRKDQGRPANRPRAGPKQPVERIERAGCIVNRTLGRDPASGRCEAQAFTG